METNKPKEKVLITGGAGFIGTHLCKVLLTSHHEVYSLDLKDKTPVENVKYIIGDARDFKLVSDIVQLNQITTIYHLAATVSVPLCQKDPIESYSHNLDATLSVLEASKNSSHPVRVAFASSAALYGNLGDRREPLREENTAPRFSSFYAAQKHASEKAIELYTEFYKIPTLIFRFFNVYGIGQDPTSPYSGVITIFTRLAKEKKSLMLYNAGTQTRDFISVADIAKALSLALELDPARWDASVLNLGSGTSTTVRELAELIRSITGSEAPIEPAPPREGDVLHSLASIERAKQLLNFIPSPNLPENLKNLILS